MARGKNRNRLFGRRSRSSNSAEDRTTRSIGRSPLLRFPPDKKKPSKTTTSKTSRGGLFGRTKKDRVKTTLPSLVVLVALPRNCRNMQHSKYAYL